MALSLTDGFPRHLSDWDMEKFSYYFSNLEAEIKAGKYILDAYYIGQDKDRFSTHMCVSLTPSDKNKEGYFKSMSCYFDFSSYEANSASLQINGTDGGVVQYSKPRDGRYVSGFLRILKDLGSKKIREKERALARNKARKAKTGEKVAAKSLRSQFPSKEIFVDEEGLKALEEKFNDLRDKVKSGDYVVAGADVTDDDYNSYLNVGIVPTARNSASTVAFLVFSFQIGEIQGVTFRIQTQDGQLFVGKRHGHPEGVFEDVLLLGREKIETDREAPKLADIKAVKNIKL